MGVRDLVGMIGWEKKCPKKCRIKTHSDGSSQYSSSTNNFVSDDDKIERTCAGLDN